MAFNEIEWRRKAIERQAEIDKQFSKETDDYKKMLLVLEDLDLSIHPHSLHGRLGYKKYLKMALKMLKKRKNNEKED